MARRAAACCARARPATVAVHDDGDVKRYVRIGHHIGVLADAATSDLHQLGFLVGQHLVDLGDVLVGDRLDIVLGTVLVVLADHLFLEQILDVVIASRRMLRTAMRPPSASWRTTRIMSLRRSSVSGGSGTRITVPAVAGFRPRSEFMIAFSMTATMSFSHGVTVSVRESSTPTFATWFSGTCAAVVLDGDVIEQAGVGAARADLGQLLLERRNALGHALTGVFLDLFQHVVVLSPIPLLSASGRHQRPDVVARHRLHQRVGPRQVEDPQRQVVVPAHDDRRRVHDEQLVGQTWSKDTVS